MRKLTATAIAFIVALSSFAQVQHTGAVEILEIDDNVATFQVEGIAAKKDATLLSAEETLFHRLFENGVEGFNNDEKLIETLNAKNKFYIEKFFDGKNAPMNRFISGVQQAGNPVKNSAGMFSCNYTIMIKYKALSRDLVQNHLRSTDIKE